MCTAFIPLESQKIMSNIVISQVPSVLISTDNLIFYEYRYYNTSLLLHPQFFFPSLLTFYLSSDHLQSKYAHLSLFNKPKNPHLYSNFVVSHEELAF